jgi:predicted RecA/RadA family phage recombinase
MATNLIQDGKLVKLPVIAGTLSGMGAVVGSYLHGVAQTDRDAAGNAVLDLGPAVYDLPVYPYDGASASAVAVGDSLYWDTGLTPDNLDKNSAGVFFGYALEAIPASPLALATIKVMLMHVQLAAGAITSGALGAGSVLAAALAANAVETAKINAAAVTLAKLAAGITPSHVVKFAGNSTPVPASPSPVATIVVTGLTGLLSTDIVVATIKVNGATVKHIASYAFSGSPLDTLTFTASGAGFVAADVISYQILRAAA